jgi:OOP family OmpA-OmpF porin
MSNIKNAALAALFAVVLGMPSVGMAQMRSADSGWYIGGHVGMADVDQTGDDDISVKILGGYQINRNFAAEVGYIDFGKTSSGGVDFKANALELVGVGILPLMDNKLGVYGKLGMFRGEAEASGPGGTAKNDSVEVTYGIGVQYNFTPQLGLRGEWQRYADVGDGASDIDVLSVGVVFRFR